MELVRTTSWTPFYLTTWLYPPNDWTGWQNCVNYDVFAQAQSMIACLSVTTSVGKRSYAMTPVHI